jgi:hypothetical protein
MPAPGCSYNGCELKWQTGNAGNANAAEWRSRRATTWLDRRFVGHRHRHLDTVIFSPETVSIEPQVENPPSSADNKKKPREVSR